MVGADVKSHGDYGPMHKVATLQPAEAGAITENWRLAFG